MGDPVRIVDLARNMIRLSGHEPDATSRSRSSAAGPGEKIHEELFNPDERPQPTHAEKILVAERPRLDPEWVEDAFVRVEDLVYSGDASRRRPRSCGAGRGADGPLLPAPVAELPPTSLSAPGWNVAASERP